MATRQKKEPCRCSKRYICFIPFIFVKYPITRPSTKSYYFKVIRPCSITFNDIFDYNDDEPHWNISKCDFKSCKTCNILKADFFFTSTLTNKTFHTRSHDDLSCKSIYFIYELVCNLCSLVYVSETQDRLNKRMYGHRSGINTTKLLTVYQHFNRKIIQSSLWMFGFSKKFTIQQPIPS